MTVNPDNYLKKLLRKLWNLVPKEARYGDHQSLIGELKEISQRIPADPLDPASLSF